MDIFRELSEQIERRYNEYNFFERHIRYKRYCSMLETKDVNEITIEEYQKLFCFIYYGEIANSKNISKLGYSDFSKFNSELFIFLSERFSEEFISLIIKSIKKSLKKTQNKQILNLYKIRKIFSDNLLIYPVLLIKNNKKSLFKLIEYLSKIDKDIYKQLDFSSLNAVISFLLLDNNKYQFVFDIYKSIPKEEAQKINFYNILVTYYNTTNFSLLKESNIELLLNDYYELIFSPLYRYREYIEVENFIEELWKYLLQKKIEFVENKLIFHKNKKLSNKAKEILDRKYNLSNRKINNEYYKKIFDKGILQITSIEDFYNDVCEKLEKLKVKIEDNRDNDKLSFYRDKKLEKPRTEEECRDVIYHRLKDKYNEDIELIREKYESNNRVDINIKSKNNLKWEIQIECKRDNYLKEEDIENQLISKYFSSEVKYGIYLIFYFNLSKKSKEALLKNIKNPRPNNVKIICIDLTSNKK